MKVLISILLLFAAAPPAQANAVKPPQGKDLMVGTVLNFSKPLTLKTGGKIIFEMGSEPSQRDKGDFVLGTVARCYLRRPKNEIVNGKTIDKLDITIPADASLTVIEDVPFHGKIHWGSYFKVRVNPSGVPGAGPVDFSLDCSAEIEDEFANFLDVLVPHLCPAESGQASQTANTNPKMNQGLNKPAVPMITEGLTPFDPYFGTKGK